MRRRRRRWKRADPLAVSNIRPRPPK